MFVCLFVFFLEVGVSKVKNKFFLFLLIPLKNKKKFFVFLHTAAATAATASKGTFLFFYFAEIFSDKYSRKRELVSTPSTFGTMVSEYTVSSPLWYPTMVMCWTSGIPVNVENVRSMCALSTLQSRLETYALTTGDLPRRSRTKISRSGMHLSDVLKCVRSLSSQTSLLSP